MWVLLTCYWVGRGEAEVIPLSQWPFEFICLILFRYINAGHATSIRAEDPAAGFGPSMSLRWFAYLHNQLLIESCGSKQWISRPDRSPALKQ